MFSVCFYVKVKALHWEQHIYVQCQYIFQKKSPKSVFIKRCSEKHTANLQENIHVKVWFQ